GSTYYLAAVFADPISDTLQLPHAWFFGIFSASLLLSGLLGPLAGRLIDEHGGRDVLTVTNLIFAAGLVCLSFAGGIVTLALAWAWGSASMRRPLPQRLAFTAARRAMRSLALRCSPVSPAPSVGRPVHCSSNILAGGEPASPGRCCILSSVCR